MEYRIVLLGKSRQCNTGLGLIWNKLIGCACYTFWGIYMITNGKKTQKASIIPINFIPLSLPIILIIACYGSF